LIKSSAETKLSTFTPDDAISSRPVSLSTTMSAPMYSFDMTSIALVASRKTFFFSSGSRDFMGLPKNLPRPNCSRALRNSGWNTMGMATIVNVLKQASRALHDNDPAWERLPSTRDEAAQYVLLVSMSGDAGLDEMITIDNNHARIQVMADTMAGSKSKEGTLKSAVEIVETNLAGLSTVSSFSITGMPFLEKSMAEMVISSQGTSLLFAAIAVALIVYLSLGRSWDSILCLIPVALTIVANFGMMGWVGISLNLVTALVSSVAVGIGIDYSVHVYSRFRQGIAEGHSPEEAMGSTIANTGRAVALNALAVAVGFAVMFLSEFPPLRHFGALIALTMLVSAGGALTILPASLLAVARRRFQNQRA
jgi:hypothetical protein